VSAAPSPWLLFAFALGLALLPACSRTDPIEQARVAAGRAPTSTLPPVPGAGEPYPNLGSVPPRPETTSPAARQALANALVADRANARYVGQPATPPVPRGQVAEAPAPLAAPMGAASPMLFGAEEDAAVPMLPPAPAPPPIAGTPRPDPEPPPSAPPPAVLGVPQAPPPPSVPAATPAAQASAPLPPAGRTETAPIAPIAIEPLTPPPPPAMPSELPARARSPEPAAAAAVPSARPDPPPVLLPAPPRGASPAAAPMARAADPPAPPPTTQSPGAQAPSPAQPVQPSVIVDRTALQPTAPRATAASGYALSFLRGTSTIVTADLAVLASLAGRGRGATFQVTGFADEAGAGRALDLPLARARAVADALRAAGVPAEQIELGGSARPGPAGRGAEVRLVYTR